MSRAKEINYNPAWTVKENAKRNGVSEPTIRNYIKNNGIDRRLDRKQRIIDDCRKYLKKHPNATWNELQQNTGHSLATIRLYREYITTKKKLSDFNKSKIEIRSVAKKQREEERIAYLNSIPLEFLKEYIKNRENNPPQKEERTDNPKIEEVSILDGISFKPYEEFRIPVSDCIQFHSKALPENRVLSNHYECIITFRGVEFYGLEQLYAALNYSDSPNILKQIMNCKSGKEAKSLCNKQFADKRDWDFEEKRYRIIALCHLFKYLSVKEYRDRLRETYPQTLVECPNGRDYHFGMVQNLDTNVFEGNNCSGRTTMIVRDMMLQKEEETIAWDEDRIGRELTEEEIEQSRNALYDAIREEYENNEQVIKDSKPLFTFLEKGHISKVRERRPKPIKVSKIDRKTKCLVVDFDFTVFDTSADDIYRKCEGKKDMEKAFEMIPQYKLYDGWQDVFDWTKKNGVKVAVLSGASRNLIEAAFEHFKLPCDAVIGYQPYIEKPNPILGNMLMEKLNIRESQIFFVGDAEDDDKQARGSQFRFFGATWGTNSQVDYFKERGLQTIGNPKELIPIMEEAGWTKPKPKILLGTIAGDMIGKPYERRDRAIKTKDFPLFEKRSKYTDDTVLTIAVMDWLLSDKEHTWDILAEKFVHYGTQYRIKGQDRCFSEASAAWLLNDNRPFGKQSKGNGAAMRVSPVGWFFDTIEEVESVAIIQAGLTHNTNEAKLGAVIAAVAVYLARTGKTKEQIRATLKKKYGLVLPYDFNLYREGYTWTSLCLDTVRGALMSFLCSNDFEDAIRNAVSLGGDADTIGAITGSIAEAYYGEVPEHIRKEVLRRAIPDEFKDILNKFGEVIGG